MWCHRRIVVACAALIVAVGTIAAPTRAQPSEQQATQFINTLIEEAIEVLKLPLERQDEREAGLMALLDARFDMPIITRLVLGRHWRIASPDQRDKFTQAFRTHIVRVYSSQLGKYEDQVVDVKQIKPLTDEDVVIFTEIVRGGEDPPLRLDWRIRDLDAGLRIVDVAAEGVSMLTTKRSEFTSVLAREGIDSLIMRLEELNATAGQVDS